MKRGFTIIEVLVTIAVLVIGLFTILMSYSLDLRKATQTRERQLALFLAENMLERIQAHPYGTAKPTEWGDKNSPYEKEFFVVLDGRKVETKYTIVVDKTAGSNGSFYGHGKQNSDRVKVLINWREPQGGGEWVDKNLTYETEVWRQNEVLK